MINDNEPMTPPPPAFHLRPAAHRGRAAPSCHVRLDRPAKRNALNDALVAQLHTRFVEPAGRRRAPSCSAARASTSAPASTCPSCSERSVAEGVLHSRVVARRVRARSSSAACRWSRCCTARWSAAASSSRAAAHIRVAERSAFYGLPEGHARHLRRRRRLGAHPAPDRRGAHDRHDADRPRLRRRGRLARRPVAVPGRRRRRASPRRFELAEQDRRQRAAVELRGDARAAAHRRHGAGRGPVRRVADGGDRRRATPAAKERMRAFLEGARGEGARSAMSGDARARALSRRAARRLARGARSTQRADGSTLRRLDRAAAATTRSALTDRLLHWADAAPERTLVAKREPDGGDWRRISYAEALRSARAIAPGAARPRPVGRAAGRDPVRQRPRAPAARARRAATPACRSRRSRRPIRWSRRTTASCATSSALLTPGLVFASDAGATRKAIAAGGAGRTRSCSARATLEGRADDAVRRAARDAGRPPRSTPRTPRSAPTRSPSSCSPRARPSCPRA